MFEDIYFCEKMLGAGTFSKFAKPCVDPPWFQITFGHLWTIQKVLYPILSALACRAPAAVPAVVPLPDPPSRRSVAGAERGRNDIGPEDSMAWLGCFSEKMSGKSSDLKNTTSCSSMQSIMVC